MSEMTKPAPKNKGFRQVQSEAAKPRSSSGFAGLTRYFVEIISSERNFLMFIGIAFLVVGMTYENAEIARWIGFLLAGYSAVANDSIQTIGTFIASNKKRPWWLLWLFIGGLFIATTLYSWFAYDGDVSHQRLMSKGFKDAPTSFSFLQVAAPLFLMILTRMKMPVSTTFLLLSSFATKPAGITGMMTKSIAGYGLSFVLAFVIWVSLTRVMEKRFTGKAHPGWTAAQWGTSGLLWSIWIAQDAANIAVYLPRSLNVLELLAFLGVIFCGLGLLFKMGGEGIQEIVDEKSSVVDVRAATVIDFVYAIILFYFKMYNKVPMSTTWVFLGLLAGRELGMSLRATTERTPWAVFKLMVKDAGFAFIGLAVSLVIAVSVNPVIRNGFAEQLGLQ